MRKVTALEKPLSLLSAATHVPNKDLSEFSDLRACAPETW